MAAARDAAAMLIAQISDLHIRAPGDLAYGRVDTGALLAKVVAALGALEPGPDLLIASGDLVDRGTAAEYAHLRDLLAPLRLRLLLVPGNHDERGALRAAFPEHRYLRDGGAFTHTTVEDLEVRLVVLDTVSPGRTEGSLDGGRLDWLAARLAEQPGRPTVIVMHHPPVDTGLPLMDRLGLDRPDAERLAGIVARWPNVERIVCGHVHRPIHARFAGTVVSTCPSTGHQMHLEFRSTVPAGYIMEPPGYLLHLWRKGTGLVTHTAVVGAFDGPHPFFSRTANAMKPVPAGETAMASGNGAGLP